jgi:hypothetical protein
MKSRILSGSVVLFIAAIVFAQSGTQRSFPTPEAAVRALVKAVQDGSQETTLTILGGEMQSALKDINPDLLKLERELFLLAAKRSVKVEKEADNPDHAIAYFGEQEWPFPAPLVRQGQSWRFDGKEGLQEIADRAIGRHELAAIAACNGYVAAQLEYSATDWNGDGILEYAQKILSSPGKKDGLYWNNDDGGVTSPLGPFLAGADIDEAKPEPLAGYYFKVLNRQGPNARGGARDYMVDGKQLLGFALVAWPAEYGKSGISTFIVNQLGDVYEKDLGQQTGTAAKAMEQFDPDSSWKKVDQD